MHTRVSKSLSPPLLSPYMEAISPLHCWLLRIFLFPPVLIRMSAGSVTCNLSARPQQLHRHGEHSHNDIVLDWGRVSGGDRWCRFSSPVPPPLFPPVVLRRGMCNFHLVALHHGPFSRGQGVIFLECISPMTIFLHTRCATRVSPLNA